MSKTPVKLFRDLERAREALKELASRGFKAEEIGMLAREGPGTDALLSGSGQQVIRGISIAQIGPVLATGPLAQALKSVQNGEGEEVLAQAVGASQERLRFYQFGLAMGGVLISVHAEGQRAEEAKALLRRVETAHIGTTGPTWVHSPSFSDGDRMSETNPRDAEMTGDFRRY